MRRFERVPEDPAAAERSGRVALDERFIAALLPESPLDRVETQELRTLVLRALRTLSPRQRQVIEQRFQHKRSPGATASRLRMSRDEAVFLEYQALEKLRRPLVEYLEP